MSYKTIRNLMLFFTIGSVLSLSALTASLIARTTQTPEAECVIAESKIESDVE